MFPILSNIKSYTLFQPIFERYIFTGHSDILGLLTFFVDSETLDLTKSETTKRSCLSPIFFFFYLQCFNLKAYVTSNWMTLLHQVVETKSKSVYISRHGLYIYMFSLKNRAWKAGFKGTCYSEHVQKKTFP